jgi:uncharacterized membrane protein
MDMIRTVIEFAGIALEVAGVAVIVIGALYATGWAVRHRGLPAVFAEYRTRLGRGILLGLEFLVAGDIINTVAVEPTFRSVGVLAVIVLIRTFLSFTLEVEMTGRWPWQGKGET